VFTTSLKRKRRGTGTRGREENRLIVSSPHPAAFKYFYDDDGQLLVDVVISTILCYGGVNPDGATAAGWNVAALETLGVPVLQAISSSMSEAEWQLSQRGLRPLDVAMNVALPEFDGRIITVPISFKGEAKRRRGEDAGTRGNEARTRGHEDAGTRGDDPLFASSPHESSPQSSPHVSRFTLHASVTSPSPTGFKR
jgi:hypothetical protein